jgi:hypothetical protein
MVLNLEQLSDENLVNFYKEELQMIGLGEKASTFFTSSVRKKLIKKGILETIPSYPSLSKLGRKTIITDLTRTIISQTGK